MRRLALFALRLLAGYVGVSYLPPPLGRVSIEHLAASAKILTDIEDRDTQSSGEAKRHRVYAKLIKLYPAVPRKDLGLAIELAVRR